ncbi:MAG: hypothetical protein WCB85_11725 [Candidatus Dormiibacterota bacterium]
MTPPRPLAGPTGAELLAGIPEALEYCHAMAPLAFPEGAPSAALAATVAGSIWRHLHDHPGPEPVAWDPEDATAQRISAAFQRGGLAAAFAEASRNAGAPPPRLRVTSYREE